MNRFSRFDPEGVGFNLEKGKFPTNSVQLGPARNRFSLGLNPYIRYVSPFHLDGGLNLCLVS